jgi:hypothetical protein
VEAEEGAEGDQVGAVEAEDVDGVFGGGGSGEPAAGGVFEEMVVEVVDTEIDEADAALLQGRRGPEGAFDAVADVAGPVEVVVVQQELGEDGAGAEVVEFEVFDAGGPTFAQEAVGTGFVEVLADGEAEEAVVLAFERRGWVATEELGHGLLRFPAGTRARGSGRAFQDGFVEGGFLAGEVGFEGAEFFGFGGGEAGDVFLLDEGAEAKEGLGGLVIEGFQDETGNRVLALAGRASIRLSASAILGPLAREADFFARDEAMGLC